MAEAPAWDIESDVVVVGYGGAGAITAITAHDLGEKVIILERHTADTSRMVNHTPSTRMSGGFFLCTTDAGKATDYLFWTSWGATPRDCCEVMGQYMVTLEEYLLSLGGSGKGLKEIGEYRDIAPGSDAMYIFHHTGGGPEHFRILMENMEKRGIPVMYDHRGMELIQDPNDKGIIGIVAENAGRRVFVKAKKALVLSTGGFEWDEEMKLNFLRIYPSYFYCNPENEGDGIKMGQKAGAALWHMNTISGRVIPYVKGIKPAFGRRFPLPFILVNKYGRRFAGEPGAPGPRHRSHLFWLECMKFDIERVEYPQVPCYEIFDETTRLKGPFATSIKRGMLTDGTIQYFHEWSKDNNAEIAKGWVIKGDTIEELASNIAAQDPENQGRMDPNTLKDTIAKFNKYCKVGEDPEFQRNPSDLKPLKTPPFYALKVYPGGANTQGGLKKNAKGQVVDPYDNVVPRLYAPGENGSYFGFLYPGGGNLSENVVWGRVTGEMVSREKAWDH